MSDKSGRREKKTKEKGQKKTEEAMKKIIDRALV